MVIMASLKFQILVVDDEPDLCALTKEYLDRTEDMIVHTCYSVQTARIALAKNHYDVIVSDYQMPGEDGIQFLKSLRERHDRTPFILFTGKGREEVVIEALNNGADAYLQKGGKATTLFAELNHHINAAVRRKRIDESLRLNNEELLAVNEELAAAEEELRSQLAEIVKGQDELTRETSFSDSLMDSLPGIFYLYDAESMRLVRWNKNHQVVSGYTEEEMFGMNVLSWHRPENARAVLDAISICMRQGTASVEAPLVIKGGKEIPYILSGKRFDTKERSFFMGVGLDISERKAIEETLRESEDMHRTILDNAGIGMGYYDKDGRLKLINSIACAYMKGKREDFIGRNIEEIYEKEIGAVFMERIRMSIASKRPMEFEDLVQLHGKSIWFLSVYNYVKGKTEKESGVLIFSHDITERKTMENALHLANRKLNLLSSITRHDINNQLMALRGQLTLLDSKNGKDTFDGHLVKALASAERISTMIHFTKEYEDIGQRAPIWQDISTLIEKCIKDVHLGQVVLQNDLSPGVEIFADPMIVKAFSNLVDNAVRHGGSTTLMRFFDEEDGGTYRIVFEDDGLGIKPEKKGSIFLPGTGKDHGFGLFLSHEILSITNIDIKEEGTNGSGARFVMTVPPGGVRKK